MQLSLTKTSVITFAFLGFLATTAFAPVPSASGVESGLALPSGLVPNDCSSLLPSCSACHVGSAPNPLLPNPNTPTTSLTTAGDIRAIPAGGSIDVTTSVSGASGTDGGFCCETTGGTFVANSAPIVGGATTILTNSASITQFGSGSRSWTYSYQAPAGPGLIEMTSAAIVADGNLGPSNEYFSFSGFNKNAAQATPIRLFALPLGVSNIGTSCSDGFGNLSVLGANQVPTAGNVNFELELHGVAPNTCCFIWGGYNSVPNYTMPLDGIGLFGCNSYIQNVEASLMVMSSVGSAERAEGVAIFPVPVVGVGAMVGMQIQIQAGCLDSSVVPPLPGSVSRTLPLSLSNGLEITIQ